VWADDVDEAIASHLGKETLEMAAKRRGVVSETLRRRLRALGIKPPKFHHRWLVTDEQVERALSLVLVRRSFHGGGSKCTFVEPEKARKAA